MTNRSWEQTAEQPLDVLAEQYRAELERLNYGRATINVYLRTIRKLGQLIGSHDLPLDQLTPDIAAELLLRADWHGDRRQYAIFVVRRFVGYLTTLGLAKPPPTARELARAALRRDYEDYLRRQRGLTEQTIGHCWRFADRFLDFRFGEAEVELGAITAGDIVAFLQRLTTRKPPYRDKTAPTHLRNFFRHLFKSGLTRSNLALCIPSVAQHYDARLPRHLTPEQVETVLGAVRADARLGRRNYAMIILLARLGLPRRKWSPSNSAISTGAPANLSCVAKVRTTIACRSRPMSAKHWPTTSGRIVSRHRARYSSPSGRRTALSRTGRSSTPY
jgi:integrase/recombinase XerD